MKTIKNLDQIRAANALEAGKKGFKGVNDGQVVKKIPTMIRENGFLGALAFAKENEDKTDHADVFRAVIDHLVSVGRLPAANTSSSSQPVTLSPLESFIRTLSNSDAATLRDITAESLAYLNYLRRFAGKEEKPC